MTPKEAIKNLKKLKSFHNGSYGTAIDHAIKALEQQPCEDCISRNELLARIDAERKHLLDLKMDGAEHIIVHHARRIIEDMPSVTPQQPCEEENPNCTECRYYDHEKHHCPRFCRVIENTVAEITSEQAKWIPVSERLPKVADCYNVTRKIGSELITDVCCFDGIDTWHNDNRINHERNYLIDIIAWMPLPQPYVESEV